MFNYFKFLGRVVFSKFTTWVLFVVSWIFVSVLLLIIPATIKNSPLTIWTFDMISLTSVFVAINATALGGLAVNVFRLSKEDQTELIILSKPINKNKILLCKFLWIIIGSLILACGNMCIAASVYFFGKYDAINNPSGIEFGKVPLLLASIFVAVLINMLVFSSIGIFLSNFANRVSSMIILSVIGLVLTSFDMISSFVLSSTNNSIVNKYGGSIESMYIADTKGKYSNFAYYDTTPNKDLYDVYKQIKTNNNATYQYLNFGNQLSSYYKSFGLDNIEEKFSMTAFGSESIYNEKLIGKNENLLSYIVNQYNNVSSNNYPFMIPYYSSSYSDDTSEKINTNSGSFGWLIPGIDINTSRFLKFLNIGSNIRYISNDTKIFDFIPGTIINDKALTNFSDLNEFDTKVYNQILIPIFTVNPIENSDIKYIDISSKTALQITIILINSFTKMCFNFIHNNSNFFKKFDLKNNREINFVFAAIKYSIARQLLKIYWNNIVSQQINILKDTLIPSLTIEKFFGNRITDGQYPFYLLFSNNDQFKYVMPFQNIEISLSQFIHTYIAYTGTVLYSLFDKPQIFAYNCFGMDIEGNPQYPTQDNILKSTLYFTPHYCINSYMHNNVNRSPDQYYFYKEFQYYDKNITSIIWAIFGVILFIFSYIYQWRSDVS